MPRVKRRVIVKKPRPRVAKENTDFLESLRRLALPAMLFSAAGAVILVFVLIQSGWAAHQLANASDIFRVVTKRAGFAVKDIVVEGHSTAERDAVLKALDINKGEAILAVDPQDALARLSAISWVKSGTVERRLPSTIYVRLNERIPIALWQNQGKFYLIDQEGHVVREAAADEDTHLPRVVGAGAEKDAANFLAELSTQPNIFQKTLAAVRVGNRRWDLHMQNNVVVKLPEEGVAETLATLARLIDAQHILDHDVVSVDMRLPDRMAIETSQPVNPPKTPPKI